MRYKVVAEMVANVWKVLVAVGDQVSEGHTICVLESMKMEIPVEAISPGPSKPCMYPRGPPSTRAM